MQEEYGISKVHILLQQKKYAEAEKILKDMLSTNPTDVLNLLLLAEVYLQLNKVESAEEIINTAIGIAPDESELYYLKSRIKLQKDNYTEAEQNIQQAISLHATDADYRAVLASIRLDQKRFEEALDIANEALELDAENILALNVRSTSLLKLKRVDESFTTIEGALRENPSNAFTHSNYGWGLLEKGDHKKALEHFKEALKIDPNQEYAQSGMMEALKASNPVYRWFLKYAFWMGNFTAKNKWFVILGFYFSVKILRSTAKSIPAIEPYLTPIIVILGLIAFSTWVITPISNLFLRFNSYGRFLLSKKEVLSSNFVAVSFGLFLIGLLAYLFVGGEKYAMLSFFGLTMMLPLSVIFLETRNKNVLIYFTIGLVLLGAWTLLEQFMSPTPNMLGAPMYLMAYFIFQWVANYQMTKKIE